MKSNKRFFLVAIAMLFTASVWLYYFYNDMNRAVPVPQTTPESEPSIQEVPLPAGEENDLPTDKLVITPERQKYESGQLRLKIPKLDVDTPVMNGTDNKSLKQGPGLYEYAQLPGEGNRNVSIAGHRDIYGSVFYYIDKLGKDDLMYLQDDKNIYEYIYSETEIIEPDDWSVIYPQGFSCLTLTSCHPIGVSSHRIIVRAKLNSITPVKSGETQK